MHKIISIFVVSLFCLTQLTAQEGAWKKAKEEKGVVVYTRSIEDSDFIAFKAVTEVNASLDEVEAALRDIENYDEWYHQVSFGEVLKKVHDNVGYCYITVDVPWPATDRDNIFKFEWARSDNGKTLTLTSHAVPDYLPTKKEFVRIPMSDSIWKITAKSNNKVEIYHQAHADPGGSIPSWMVNNFVVNGPIYSLSRLRERVENGNDIGR